MLAANYPVMIESPAVASNGTFAYSAAGFVAGVVTNDVYRYDPVANTWTQLANIPTALADAGIVYAANTNKIYVFGGFTGSTVLNTTQIYDIATNTWSSGAAMPAGRAFPGAAYYSGNGKIYVIGGFDPSPAEANQTWEYNPAANTWNTSRANIPVAMAGAGYSIIGQYIYMAGHWSNGAGSTDHYRYDIVGNTWAAKAPVPVPIYRPAAAGVGTKEYLVGGGNPLIGALGRMQNPKTVSLQAPAVSYISTFIYDTASNTWTTGPNTNVAHSLPGGTAITNLLLVVGGYNGSADTNTVEKSVIPLCGTPNSDP
jgi:N-acetylneuraminic acid mutarotase